MIYIITFLLSIAFSASVYFALDASRSGSALFLFVFSSLALFAFVALVTDIVGLLR